jgi:hypothetical protein
MADVTNMTEAKSTDAAPFTLRFIEWQCGHHGTRPDDIPCHSIEQAQNIVWAIGYAISQPGYARAALFDAHREASIYITDDYATEIKPDEWYGSYRTTIYHATEQEWAELQGLRAAYEYTVGGEIKRWDGTTYLDDIEVVTTLSIEDIKAAIEPVCWYEADQRRAVCAAPPIIKPAAELLAELREAAEEMGEEQ